MGIKILRFCITVAIAVVCLLILMKKIQPPFGLDEKVVGWLGLTATFVYNFIEIFKKKQPNQIVFDTGQADKWLVEQIYLRDKTIEDLKEELARKDLPSWEQVVKTLLEKGELQKAIESINTDASDEEATPKHIRKAQLYIANLQFNQAEQHYQQAAAIFPSYDNNRAIANFYYDLNKFHEAIHYYQKCLNLAASPEEKAIVLNSLGVMQHRNNAYPAAEASYNEALKTFRELVAKNPDAWLPYVAMTLDNMGNLQYNQNEYPAAEASYQEALKIRRELAAKNPDAYLSDVTMTLNNIVFLQKDKNDFRAAAESCQEALTICKELAAKNPDVFLPDEAMTLNNLGVLQYNQNEYPAAEASYQEALKIRRELADKNPDAYLPYVAMTLNNLGILQKDQNKYPAAEASYQEALKIYIELAAKNPDAWLPNVAMILNNLGVLQNYQKDYPAAEASFREALKERRELAAKNPDAFLPDVATTLVNLSMFYQDAVPNKELSLQYANEAKEALRMCYNTPLVQEQSRKAKQVIEVWNNQ